MASSFVESSPLNRDQMSIANPSMNTYRGFHQRSYSNQIIYASLPQQAQTIVQKQLPQQPSLFSSFSSIIPSQKSDQETQVFQSPNSSSLKQNMKVTDKSIDEFLRELSQKKRQQTRSLRCHKLEDLKSDINFQNIITGQNKESTIQQVQALNNNNKDINSPNLNYTQETHSEVSTSSPSPLILQFANMDLRKRASIVPIKPIEMNFDKQLQTKLGSKFHNLKIEGKIEKMHNSESESEVESEQSSPVEKRINMRKNLLKQFTKLNQHEHDDHDDDDQSIESDCSHEGSIGDDDEDDNTSSVGFASENLIIEVKSQKHHLLKSILKKTTPKFNTFLENKMELQNINLDGESSQLNYQSNLLNDQNSNILRQIQLPHQRSNSLTVLPSNYNVNNYFSEQSYQHLSQQKIHPQQQYQLINNTPVNSNTTATNTPSTQNVLSNRDMNLQLQSFSSFTKDYQFSSNSIPVLEKQAQSSPSLYLNRGQLKRSQSLTGIIKKVQFNVSNQTGESYSTLSDAGFSLQYPQCKYQQQQNPSSFINQINFSTSSQYNIYPSFSNQTRQKSNSFNKFYSAFKQNLNNSNKSQVFSSPQAKSLNSNKPSTNQNGIYNNPNNSINSTVSTTPSFSSFSQYSNNQINNQFTANSNSSSASSTPMAASHSSISNTLTPPLSAQINNDRKNPTSSTILNSVFKDMKLTKNTKVYFDQKCGQNSPSSVGSPSIKNIHISSFNQSSSLFSVPKQNENSPQVKRIPSSESISLSTNA
ncbi:hypothetical protein TTHERM_00006130 (macronuclear) [Tetrahymena thermophila SB210]|uniref:Uncharacterized protein n=1 Tax=Tetrahymena thermophila (strain SB210) TaxID=312017 RepID=Q22SC3_TETTS|nr:hypothetical protein TTHERM_00006130 [Tetrahymena thermophila SB210]EAR87849.1 hypothetical protein TTHERM_00006130 [Tetrahymena thermophila SB210]|eukprot:XP_001008094.1 hypothetical protein TTHERM_00006130 [Tetrahymena thermophila SB210]